MTSFLYYGEICMLYLLTLTTSYSIHIFLSIIRLNLDYIVDEVCARQRYKPYGFHDTMQRATKRNDIYMRENLNPSSLHYDNLTPLVIDLVFAAFGEETFHTPSLMYIEKPLTGLGIDNKNNKLNERTSNEVSSFAMQLLRDVFRSTLDNIDHLSATNTLTKDQVCSSIKLYDLLLITHVVIFML